MATEFGTIEAFQEAIDGTSEIGFWFYLAKNREALEDVQNVTNLARDFFDKHGRALLNAKGLCGWTPLHLAALSSNMKGIHLLLQWGADPTCKDATEKTPADCAPNEGVKKAFQYLRRQQRYKLYGLTRFFGKNANTNPLLYSIAQGNTQASLNHLAKKKQRATQPDRQTLLRPLHLCAISNNIFLAKELTEKYNVPVSVQDKQGWTPLHHAALQEDRTLLDILLEADKKQGGEAANIPNCNGGTYEDVRRLAFPQELLEENAPVFHYQADNGRITPGTAAKFKQMTGADYVTQMHASPNFFIEEWARPTETKFHEKGWGGQKVEYEQYLQNPPPLYLARVEVGHGLFATEAIPKGTIITNYLGKATHKPENPDYLYPGCDGAKFRNLGPMANEGVPNCAVIPLVNYKGIPETPILRAVENIEAGAQILLDYGNHPVKKGKYVQYASEETVLQTYSKQFLERYVQLLLKSKSRQLLVVGIPQDDETLNAITKIEYLVRTTPLQLQLMLKGVIKKDTLSSIVRAWTKLETPNQFINNIDAILNYLLSPVSAAQVFCQTSIKDVLSNILQSKEFTQKDRQFLKVLKSADPVLLQNINYASQNSDLFRKHFKHQFQMIVNFGFVCNFFKLVDQTPNREETISQLTHFIKHVYATQDSETSWDVMYNIAYFKDSLKERSPTLFREEIIARFPKNLILTFEEMICGTQSEGIQRERILLFIRSKFTLENEDLIPIETAFRRGVEQGDPKIMALMKEFKEKLSFLKSE